MKSAGRYSLIISERITGAVSRYARVAPIPSMASTSCHTAIQYSYFT